MNTNFQDFINAQKANQIKNKKYVGVDAFNVQFNWDEPVNNTRRLKITLIHPTYKDFKANYFIKFSTDDDISSKGSKRYVDIKGETSYYVNDINELKNDRFDKSNYRLLKKGEGDFIDFISKFINYLPPKEKNGVKPDYTKTPFPVWDIQKLINGDTSEFDMFFEAFKDNMIVAMIGFNTIVKEEDGERKEYVYQEVFNKDFRYAWTFPSGTSQKAIDTRNKTIESYKKSLNDPKNSSNLNSIFEATEFKEYVPNINVATNKDDLPF
jgi:hypothetical protein